MMRRAGVIALTRRVQRATVSPCPHRQHNGFEGSPVIDLEVLYHKTVSSIILPSETQVIKQNITSPERVASSFLRTDRPTHLIEHRSDGAHIMGLNHRSGYWTPVKASGITYILERKS